MKKNVIRKPPSLRNRLYLAASASLLWAAPARAQSGAALLVKPWPAEQAVEAKADAYFFNAGHTDAGDSFRLSTYESSGRVRIEPGNVISPRVGYDFTFLDSHTSAHGIPNQLSDESIAVGTAVGKYQDWIAGLTLGIGYAGDSAFSRSNGWYGKADFVAGRSISKTDTLLVVVDYDGNRDYLPDVPLPGFAYRHQIDPNIELTLGVPYSGVLWKPIAHLEVEVNYYLVSDIDARIGYEVMKGVNLFATYARRREGYHVQELAKDRRLLFKQQRVEIGASWKPTEMFAFTVAAGYGFAGEFETGFDFSTTRRVAKISDEPYVRGGLEFRF